MFWSIKWDKEHLSICNEKVQMQPFVKIFSSSFVPARAGFSVFLLSSLLSHPNLVYWVTGLCQDVVLSFKYVFKEHFVLGPV